VNANLGIDKKKTIEGGKCNLIVQVARMVLDARG
jgi:hypothetical protein